MPANRKKQIDFVELEHSDPVSYEKKYVHDVYNKIARHFSATRHYPWPMVESYLKSLPKESVMIDVGCGNGKNLGISPGKSLGCDICPELLKIAQAKGHDVVQCDALSLP